MIREPPSFCLFLYFQETCVRSLWAADTVSVTHESATQLFQGANSRWVLPVLSRRHGNSDSHTSSVTRGVSSYYVFT
ncbi:hypothetical protein BDR04DRAFT_448769 [Suillus decipiens]|nr:hypothetical protein BDR04DRAFT_448769 [Suillus decipiens]